MYVWVCMPWCVCAHARERPAGVGSLITFSPGDRVQVNTFDKCLDLPSHLASPVFFLSVFNY